LNYEVEIGERIRHVAVRRQDGRYDVTIDDRQWVIDAVRIDPQTLSLVFGPPQAPGAASLESPVPRSSFEVTVLTDRAPGRLNVRVGAISIGATLNGRRRRGRSDAGDAGAGPQRLTAPMPGKIVRVLVKTGEAVRARQPLVVVEAMKMENELRAAGAGLVAEIHVREGQSVDPGDLLLVIASGAASGDGSPATG